MRRSILTLVTATTAAAASLLVSVPTAHASSTGCTRHYGPNSCIRLDGTSTFLNYVEGGVSVGAQKQVRGFFLIRSPNPDIKSASGASASYRGIATPEETYSNNSHIAGETKWGPKIQFYKHLPDGTQICANFVEVSNGQHKYYPAACKNIER